MKKFLQPCDGEHTVEETLVPVLPVAFELDGVAYTQVGSHWVYTETQRRLQGCGVPMIPRQVYCVERISDGARFDLSLHQTLDKSRIQPLNAMEVLARVKEDHVERSRLPEEAQG